MQWKPRPTGGHDCRLLGHVHLVSIDIKSKHSSRRPWFAAIVYSRRYAELHVLYRRNFISSLVNCERCGFWLCVNQKWEGPVYLFFRITTECTACSWYYGFYSISHWPLCTLFNAHALNKPGRMHAPIKYVIKVHLTSRVYFFMNHVH